MPKIPKSAKKEIPRKCILCGRVFKSKEYLVYHLDKAHKDNIPEGWSASRYENYLRTGKNNGTCVVCKSKTDWNESTWKYNRLCGKKECVESLSKSADKHMISKYGKKCLLDDPEQQRKMIYAKHTSGTYYWSTDSKHQYPKMYASQIELKFLQMLDVFLNLDVKDILSPSPNNYVYIYNNEKHLYIPDVYIVSMNLEIELKEPKDNQNMHPKIQAVDKVKESLKDEMMNSIDVVNYIKVNGTDYAGFFETFNRIKNSDVIYKDESKPQPIKESLDEVMDSDLNKEMEKMLEMINQEPVLEGGSRDSMANDFMFNMDMIMNDLPKIIHGDNSLTFNKEYDRFKKMIKMCDEPNTLYRIKLKLGARIKQLKELGNLKDITDKGYSYQFEAKRALPMFESLYEDLLSKLKKYKVKGAPEPKSIWYQNVNESVITAESNGVKYHPIFVVLTQTYHWVAKLIKDVTHGNYSHSSISLDTGLRNMCSFNGQGFVDEDIMGNGFENEKSTYAIYMYLATEPEYQLISSIIGAFHNNRDQLKYSLKGLFNYYFGKETHYDNKWFCSEFVSYLLSQANPKMLKSHYSLYSPDDLSETRKMRKLDEGFIKNYDQDYVDKKVASLLTKRGFEHVRIESTDVE